MQNSVRRLWEGWLIEIEIGISLRLRSCREQGMKDLVPSSCRRNRGGARLMSSVISAWKSATKQQREENGIKLKEQ
jgi:hypothetical protein